MYSTNQLRDFSALFTRSEVIRLLDGDFNSIDSKINRYPSCKRFKGSNYLSFFKHIYKVLEKKYPNEYIFKNQFLNTWLKNELGNDNSIIFSELRLGKAIADLAMFNGISKVFEIKTILDKDYRLSNQLSIYKKIFNEVYIIIPSSLLNRYEAYDESVGIILYDESNFYLEREATRNYELDSALLMEVLHTKEYRQMVLDHYAELPQMNSFNQFEICSSLIKNIPVEELNKLFLQTIKRRKLNNSFFKSTNIEFNQICLSLNLNLKQRTSLIDNLKNNII